MLQKKYFLIFLLLSINITFSMNIVDNNLHSSEYLNETNLSDTTDTNIKTRGTLSVNPLSLFLISVGYWEEELLSYFEIGQLTYGYPLGNDFFMSGKISILLNRTLPLGIKLTKQFPDKLFLGLDCLNIELTQNLINLNASDTPPKGIIMSLSLSKENISTNSNKFFWSIGGYIFLNNENTIFYPNLTFGITF